MIEQLVECEQVVEILACNVLKDLFASIGIQMANDELEEMRFNMRQIDVDERGLVSPSSRKPLTTSTAPEEAFKEWATLTDDIRVQ
jgi:hypothetical protein